MIPAKTDIDIDFGNRDQALKGLKIVYASTAKNNQSMRHASGVYFQDIPVNPLNGLSAFDYARAEELGYFKIDFLNQSVYAEITDEAHLDRLLNTDPYWELLEEPEFTEQLMHIHNHYEVVQTIKPKSIIDLAIVLALIRPGKRHLLNKSRDIIDKEIWLRGNDDGYTFRKAHAISYAALIVVQMNLIVEKLNNEIENSGQNLIQI